MTSTTQTISGVPRSETEISLQQETENHNLGDDETNGYGSSQLEPTDKGPSAWKMLVATFMFEAVLYGFSLSFGVFQNHYSHLPEFHNSPLIPFVGSVATGMAFLSAPMMTSIVRRYPKQRQPMIWFGWAMSISGLVAGSFVNTLPGLIMTQGVMYGVGFVTFYLPIFSLLNEWWIVRRGFAWGFIASAGGASGIVFPFIIEALLKRWGHKTSLRALAVAMAILTGPLLPFFKPRIPVSQRGAVSKTDRSFLKNPLFWVYSISNVAQGMGFFFPALFLPSYATSIGLSSTTGALLLALMSMAQFLGQFTFGWLSDGRLPLNLLVATTTIVAAVSSLALWGMARSQGYLIAFALIYGFFGYAYVSMRVRMGTAVSAEPTAAIAMFGLFCFGQGIGNVLSGPISAGIVTKAANVNGYGAVRYKPVILFTGASMVASTLILGSWYLRPQRIRAAFS